MGYAYCDGGGTSKSFPSPKKAEEEYYIKVSYDYLGSAIRDNSREEKIYFGKGIDKYGTDDYGNIAWPKSKSK